MVRGQSRPSGLVFLTSVTGGGQASLAFLVRVFRMLSPVSSMRWAL